jgi:hypothetical protein
MMLVRYEDSEPVYPTSTGLSISTIGFWPREKHTLPTDAQSGTVISVEHSATEPINLDPAFGRFPALSLQQKKTDSRNSNEKSNLQKNNVKI